MNKKYLIIYILIVVLLIPAIILGLQPCYMKVGNHSEYSELNFRCEKVGDCQFAYDVDFIAHNYDNYEKTYSNLIIQMSNGNYLQCYNIDEFTIQSSTSEKIELNFESNQKYTTIKLLSNSDGLQETLLSVSQSDNGWFVSWGYNLCLYIMIILMIIFIILFWIFSKKWLFNAFIVLLPISMLFVLICYLVLNLGDINTIILSTIGVFLPIIQSIVLDKTKKARKKR